MIRRWETGGAARISARSAFPGHPQETTENSVDLAHLRYVHGYVAVKPVGETTVDGAYLLTRFDFKRRRRIAGFTDPIYDISATAHIHGPGYSFVEVVDLVLVLADAGAAQAQAADLRARIPAGEAAHPAGEQDPEFLSGEGRSPGCHDLGKQEMPSASDSPQTGRRYAGTHRQGKPKGRRGDFETQTHLEGTIDRWAKSRSA